MARNADAPDQHHGAFSAPAPLATEPEPAPPERRPGRRRRRALTAPEPQQTPTYAGCYLIT
jgi:hypothetical protein